MREKIDLEHGFDCPQADLARSPLLAEEALALIQAALGDDLCSGLLLAVSGGPDSVALLGLAAAQRACLPPLFVASVDHGLRPESAFEAQDVGEFCARLGLPHALLRWKNHPEGSVSQQAAREARYQLLSAHAAEIGVAHLVTAHMRDDQAETVLIRLASGSSIGGLGAMRCKTRRGAMTLLRPFLSVPKSRLVATCEAQDWGYCADPSNYDWRFARARMRAIMPVLAKEGLTAERLANLAQRAQRLDDAVDQLASRMLEASVIAANDAGRFSCEAGVFVNEPFEIALRMLSAAMRRVVEREGSGLVRGKGHPLSLYKLEAMTAALRQAIADQQPFSRSLAGILVRYRGAGGERARVECQLAPPRRSPKSSQLPQNAPGD
jgi:tRNA(Ile)-lysidine synthase